MSGDVKKDAHKDDVKVYVKKHLKILERTLDSIIHIVSTLFTDQKAHEGADGVRVPETLPPWLDGPGPGDPQAPESALGIDVVEGEAARLVLNHPGAHTPPGQAPHKPTPGTSHHSRYGQFPQITMYNPGLWLAVHDSIRWRSGCHPIRCPH